MGFSLAALGEMIFGQGGWYLQISVSEPEMLIFSPDAAAPVSTQLSSTRPHFLSDRGDDTGRGMTVLLTGSGPGYLLGFAGNGSKEKTSSCCWLGSAQIVREFWDNCTNTHALLTDVQRHPRSSLLLSEEGGQQSSHQTNNYFYIYHLKLMLSGDTHWGSLRCQGITPLSPGMVLHPCSCLRPGLLLSRERKKISTIPKNRTAIKT